MTNRKTFCFLFALFAACSCLKFLDFFISQISGEVLFWATLVGNRKQTKRVVNLFLGRMVLVIVAGLDFRGLVS